MPSSRTLRNLGEDRLVAVLTADLPTGRDVILGHGDDCAIIGRPGDRLWQLLKTDCLIESIHFEPDAPARRVGWKAMARALSDIAAMGGIPRHALVTIAVHPDTPLARVKGIYQGLRDAAGQFHTSIVGGETARSPGPMFLSIALTGEVEPRHCILRSAARPGDTLYVTGRLGRSIEGRHLRFVPRIEEAQWLAKRFTPGAMMDLSDGIGSDLPRLARASRCGFELDESAIPRHRGASVKQALSDGEDYELLFTLDPARARRLESAWKRRFPNLPLTAIGRMLPQSAIRNPQSAIGHDHFA